MKDETDLFAASFESIRHRLGDQNLTQVADVDIAGRADAGYDNVWSRPELRSHPLGPQRYV